MRVNFEAEEPVIDLIGDLKELCGGVSMKQVIIAALLAFKWMLDQERQGRKIAAIDVDDDGHQQVKVEFQQALAVPLAPGKPRGTAWHSR